MSRALTNRRDKVRRNYQWGYGVRPLSNWGSGGIRAPWAEGDVVNIPASSPAFLDGRIPHSWSRNPDECKPGLYRVVSAFSIGEGSEWYFRVCPIIDGETMWDNSSDRLHVFPDGCDYTAGWELIESADPDNLPIDFTPAIESFGSGS